MVVQDLDGTAVRYAVRIGRRLRMSEREMAAMVQVLEGPFASVEVLAMSASAARERSARGQRARGLRVIEDPLGARIATVVRALESLIVSGYDREQALTKIKQHAGSDLDAEVVGELLSVIRQQDLASIAGALGGGETGSGSAARPGPDDARVGRKRNALKPFPRNSPRQTSRIEIWEPQNRTMLST